MRESFEATQGRNNPAGGVASRKRCPECGTPVKAGNLAQHYERVHPRAQLKLSKEERQEIDRAAVVRRERPTARVRGRVVAVIAAVVLIAGLGIVGYQVLSSSQASGRLDVEPASWDFGNISQVTVSHTFTMRNVGTTPLRIDGISTSCMCTTAHLDYVGEASPMFGYHQNPSWSLVMAPGTQGSLTVHYDPTVHPDRGDFDREVYILSSDPVQRETSVTIHVFEV